MVECAYKPRFSNTAMKVLKASGHKFENFSHQFAHFSRDLLSTKTCEKHSLHGSISNYLFNYVNAHSLYCGLQSSVTEVKMHI